MAAGHFHSSSRIFTSQLFSCCCFCRGASIVDRFVVVQDASAPDRERELLLRLAFLSLVLLCVPLYAECGQLVSSHDLSPESASSIEQFRIIFYR